jgi:hypothetical protein
MYRRQQHGFPLEFVTEASINLANDRELIDLMVQANFALFLSV